MTSRRWLVEVVRLTGLLAGVSLATSRLGLLVHELVGHGGVAIALGGGISDVSLFWFAGGWVQSSYEPTRVRVLAVMLGGITVELIAGGVLWLAPKLLRRDSLAASVVRAVGATLMVHALFYLAAGTYHGFGDGAALYRELGDARLLLALVAGAASCAMAYLGARLVIRPLLATLPARRVAGLAIAIVVAGGLQVALAVGEVQIRRDATYARIMKPERDRLTERELAEWLLRHRDATEAERRELAHQNRDLPFAIVLGIAVVAAVGAGALRSREISPAPISNRLLVATAVVALGSLAAVVAIDVAFG